MRRAAVLLLSLSACGPAKDEPQQPVDDTDDDSAQDTADDSAQDTADDTADDTAAPDADGDGFAPPEDCDDDDALTYPGARDPCGDGWDQDCSGDDACAFEGAFDLKDADATIIGDTAGGDAGRLIDLGDMNGDGALDVLVGTWARAGYLGGAGVVSGPLSGERQLGADGPLLLGTDDAWGAGRSIGVGDTDGDGLDDLSIGAPYAAPGLYLFHGPVTASGAVSDADTALLGPVGTYTGHGSDIGDLDGDGYADAAVGSYNDCTAATYAGAIYIVYGPLDGRIDLNTRADGFITGESAEDYAARMVRIGGDLDGDGVGDLLVPAMNDAEGAPGAGAVFVIYGPPTRVSSLYDADGKHVSLLPNGHAGHMVDVGDTDGDGLADLLVGAPSASADAGAAFLVLGPASGATLLPDAAASFSGSGGVSAVGAQVRAGDTDGDGLDDVAIGAAGGGPRGGGGAWLFHGPVSGAQSNTSADATFDSDEYAEQAGTGLAIGDMNGDGLGDLLVGAPNSASAGAGAGTVYLLLAGG